MSTEYYIKPALTEGAFLAKPPEGLIVSLRKTYTLDLPPYVGVSVHAYTIKDKEGYCLWAYFFDGILQRFERFGGNKVLEILRELATTYSVEVTNDIGAWRLFPPQQA